MIIGVCGFTKDKNGNVGSAHAGKDTVADYLVYKYGFIKISLGDEIKRICLRLWEFDEDQLWGGLKEEPDTRYLVNGEYLTPRHAMQQLGTDVARCIDPDVWTRITLRVARDVLDSGYGYSSVKGINRLGWLGELVKGVVIPDVRFPNEAQAILEAGGRLWGVLRTLDTVVAGSTHASEKSQGLGDLVGHYLVNDGTIAQLHGRVDSVMEAMHG